MGKNRADVGPFCMKTKLYLSVSIAFALLFGIDAMRDPSLICSSPVGADVKDENPWCAKSDPVPRWMERRDPEDSANNSSKSGEI